MVSKLNMKIKTNNQPREILRWADLTTKEKGEFDYLDTEEKQYEAQFVRYKRWIYNSGDFMCVQEGGELFGKWDGYHSDSYSSGVVIKFVGDCVIMGTYFS